jgi:hypothetical protein
MLSLQAIQLTDLLQVRKDMLDSQWEVCLFFRMYEGPLDTAQHSCTLAIRNIVKSDCRFGTFAVKLQTCHSQLTLYARNIPNVICEAPPDDEQCSKHVQALDSQ